MKKKSREEILSRSDSNTDEYRPSSRSRSRQSRQDTMSTDLGVDRGGHLVQKENMLTTREAEPPMLTTAHHETGLTEISVKVLIMNKVSHAVILRMTVIQGINADCNRGFR